MLNPRAIACSGVGFGTLAIATLGFLGQVGEQIPVEPEKTHQAGGVGDDARSGYVWRDHAWVKATKYTKYGVDQAADAAPIAIVSVQMATTRFGTRTGALEVHTLAAGASRSNLLALRQPLAAAAVANTAEGRGVAYRHDSHRAEVELLDLDEIVALVELMDG